MTIISSTLIGQTVHFDDCSVSPMSPTSEKPPTFVSQDLKEFFLEELPENYFNKSSKQITLQILIDKEGNPCCKSILNSDSIDTELLKATINQMPRWVPASNKGKVLNVSTVIQLETKKGQLRKVTIIGGVNNVEGKTSQHKGIKSTDDIEEALINKETLTSFTLHGKELKEIDPRIGELENLKELYLGGNNFDSIPEELFKLKNLEQLLIYDNNLKNIPSGISGLTNLKFLMLQNNNIEILPRELGDLKGLLFLDLSGNPLKEGEIENLTKLLPICQIKK